MTDFIPANLQPSDTARPTTAKPLPESSHSEEAIDRSSLQACTRPELSIVDVDPDLEIIDNLGVTAVARALDLSREAIRLWRIKGAIPDNRRDDLRQLTANELGQVGQPQPSLPPTSIGQAPINLFDVAHQESPAAGSAIKARAEVAIAQRLAELAGDRADQVKQTFSSDAQDEPVRGYSFRLAILLALDFPVLTMAFESVTHTSPIVAAGSAVALSLFLVIGAHLLGGTLRQAAIYLPAWCRHAVVLLALFGFLAGIVAVTWDLRMKGLDLEVVDMNDNQGSVFGSSSNQAAILPETFRATIGYAAALVTIGSLLFGTAWSYRQHGPRTAWLKAESTYRRRIRNLAKAGARMKRTQKALIIGLLAANMLVGMSDHLNAADCDAGTVLAFIDTTTAFDDVDRQIIMPAIEVMATSLEPDQRMVIRTIRDEAVASRLLFDACVPKMTDVTWTAESLWHWLTTNKSVLAAERQSFFDDIQAALAPELEGAGGADQSAIMDTLVHYSAGADTIVSIWLFSDLLDSSTMPPGSLLSGNLNLLLAQTPSSPNLAGAFVYVAGIGRWHDQERRMLHADERANLIDMWTAIISAMGGEFRLVHDRR